MKANTSPKRAAFFTLLPIILMALSCGTSETGVSDIGSARDLVAEAKKDIAAMKYSEAQHKCEKAEKLDASNVEALYCVVAANLGGLVQTLSSIISLIASQVDAPEYSAASICAPGAWGATNCGGFFFDSLLSDIEGQLAYIDLYAYKLAKTNNPTFQIDDFPLALDASDILKLTHAGSDIKDNGDHIINLKGTWDISEIVALGAAVNVTQGFLDYVLAHSLVIESIDLGIGSEGFAKFLSENKKLFLKDPEKTGRFTGNDVHKGLKNDFLAAISYAVGRTDDMVRVAPAFGGFTAAIKQSVTNNAPDAVVKFTDADGDGIPEKIAIPALIETGFVNPLSVKTWQATMKLGEGLRDNIEKGGKSVPLQTVLAGIAKDLSAGHPTIRILASNKPVPNLFAVNAATFLDHPKYIRELVPYYFTYLANDATTTTYDLAFEKEVFNAPGINQIEKIGHVFGSALDFAHFSYPVSIDAGGGTVAHDFVFEEFKPASADALLIPTDGVTATAKVPELFYIALQDPSFGGLLEFNVDGLFSPANNFSFNKSLNGLLKYYCLNTTIEDTEGDMDIVGILDDANPAYDSNKIADCD